MFLINLKLINKVRYARDVTKYEESVAFGMELDLFSVKMQFAGTKKSTHGKVY